MPPKRPSPCLQARLAVLTSTLGAAAGLLRIGYPPIAATLIALGGAAGAVEISCRLTNPHPAPAARITGQGTHPAPPAAVRIARNLDVLAGSVRLSPELSPFPGLRVAPRFADCDSR